MARDPHWLYAHWDLSAPQREAAAKASARGEWVLRVLDGEGRVVAEERPPTEARSWFVHVARAGARYRAELGTRRAGGEWGVVVSSEETLTPAEEVSGEGWVRFETLPPEVPLAVLVKLVTEALPEHPPLLEAIAELRAEGWPGLPALHGAEPGPWSPEQEQALAGVLSTDATRRVWFGSLEITELVRRQWLRDLSLSSTEWALGEQPGGIDRGPGGAGGPGSVTSPTGGPGGEAAGGPRDFWFNVNVELIVYGATDPNATVTVGERPIRLRPDGTFSYRFSLPDGEYGLPLRAVSPDAAETRVAELGFRRSSAYRGEVGVHPQERGLRVPGVESVG